MPRSRREIAFTAATLRLSRCSILYLQIRVRCCHWKNLTAPLECETNITSLCSALHLTTFVCSISLRHLSFGSYRVSSRKRASRGRSNLLTVVEAPSCSRFRVKENLVDSNFCYPSRLLSPLRRNESSHRARARECPADCAANKSANGSSERRGFGTISFLPRFLGNSFLRGEPLARDASADNSGSRTSGATRRVLGRLSFAVESTGYTRTGNFGTARV